MRLGVRCANCGGGGEDWSCGGGEHGRRDCEAGLRLADWYQHGRDWYCPECAKAARLAAESMSPASGGG